MEAPRRPQRPQEATLSEEKLRGAAAEAGEIIPVRTAEDLAWVLGLFRAYASSLDIDLCYQNFGMELATLPGQYAPPTGDLLLARTSGGMPVGCVGLRPIPPEGCCEMKRLYVVPEARGTGIGKRLVEAAIQTAQRIGYREMRLDTLPSMTEAVALYRNCGFEPIEPYYETPVAGTIFLRRGLVRNNLG
jgi:GNAT superfamily N-acetyltransferase